MKTSEETKNIIKKIYEVQNQVTGVDKNAKNPFFKSDYVDLNAILSHIYPILQEGKLIINQSSLQRENYLDTTTRITDIETGEWMENSVSVPVGTMKAQEGGSSLTYSRRYGIMTFLSLKTEDDDGNAGSGNVSGAKKEKQLTAEKVQKSFSGEVVEENKSAEPKEIKEKLSKLPEEVSSWMREAMKFSRKQAIEHCEKFEWDHGKLMDHIDGGI